MDSALSESQESSELVRNKSSFKRSTMSCLGEADIFQSFVVDDLSVRGLLQAAPMYALLAVRRHLSLTPTLTLHTRDTGYQLSRLHRVQWAAGFLPRPRDSEVHNLWCRPAVAYLPTPSMSNITSKLYTYATLAPNSLHICPIPNTLHLIECQCSKGEDIPEPLPNPQKERKKKHNTMSAYTRQKAKSKYRNSIPLEMASQKQSSDTHKPPYDRVKRCRELVAYLVRAGHDTAERRQEFWSPSFQDALRHILFHSEVTTTEILRAGVCIEYLPERLTVTPDCYEAVLKFYFRDIPPSQANKALPSLESFAKGTAHYICAYSCEHCEPRGLIQRTHSMPRQHTRQPFARQDECVRSCIISVREAGWTFRSIARYLKQSAYTVSPSGTQWEQEKVRVGPGEPPAGKNISWCDRLDMSWQLGIHLCPPLPCPSWLAELDVSSRRPLRPEHRRARVAFCRERAVRQLVDCRRVVFSDESRSCVWIQTTAELESADVLVSAAIHASLWSGAAPQQEVSWCEVPFTTIPAPHRCRLMEP
ncbi:hypothetical protein PR048_014235 [Dryococelus australis]|uniref:Uncharacterized protein n=1 Tax=Dryococelus australis TaxID=614101 RepID=A0ABQ9HDV3_9NEOP|nr:hypothetical protein PR048_014235 [Dryococelus australis]